MKNKLQKRVLIPLLSVTVFFSATAFKNDFFEIAKQIEIFTTLFKELNLNYVDDTNPGELMDTAIKSMLADLDPYTNYYNEQDVESARINNAGDYTGIGANVLTLKDRLVIIEPYKDYAADKAGLKAGDEIIKVDNIVEGTVERIGFRSTLVRRFDSSPIMVPNFNFAENAVTNFSNMRNRRIYWTIGLEYRTTHEQLKNIRDKIESYITSNSSFVKGTEEATFVRIDKFSDSSIDLLVYCFAATKKWGEWLEIKENLAYEIKQIVETEKAGFAFPSTSIYYENSPN